MNPKKTIWALIALSFMAQVGVNDSKRQEEINPNTMQVKSAISLNEDKTEVLSYEDVFYHYYEMALDEKTKEGKDFIDFETFCDNYYRSNMDIKVYTESWKRINTDNFQEYPIDNGQVMPIPSSSQDEDYIISADYYSVTPFNKFKKLPEYGNTDYIFSRLSEGDIVYETRTVLWNSGHNAMITNTHKEGKRADGSSVFYYETIEAVLGDVQYGYLDDNRMVKFGVKILRVRGASYSQINSAKYFMERQLGKDYDLNILRTNESIDSKKWYCSELVWAAYNYVGIDLCTIGGVGHGQPGNTGGPLPYSIYACDYTYEIFLSDYYLKLSIVKKEWSNWTIRLKNSSNSYANASYNSKMCFIDDASNWTKLNDLQYITISPYGYKDVQISENWFATSVVASVVKNKKRYISYGDALVEASKNIMVRYKEINA